MAQVSITCDCPDQPPQGGQGAQAVNWQEILQKAAPLLVQLILTILSGGGNPPAGQPQGQQPQGRQPQSGR